MPAVLWLALLAVLQEPAPLPLATEADRRAVLLRSLVTHGDAAAIEYTLRELERGLPPQVLATFLETARLHPQLAFAAAIERLCHYRTVSIRVRALLALASIEGWGARAAWLAMDDTEPRLRRLGLMLAERHTNPALEEAALRLREREPWLTP